METKIEKILQKHRWIELDILKLEQEIADLHLKAECIGSFDYSSVKVLSSPSPDANYTRIVELIDDRTRKLKTKLCNLMYERQKIEELLDKLPDDLQNYVLYQHYVLCKTYEYIAESMNYSIENIYVLRKKGIVWLENNTNI